MVRENGPLQPETWLSTKETAWVLGKTERTIRYWVQYRQIPCARGAGEALRHKFRALDLLRWLQCGRMEKAPEAINRLVGLMAITEVPEDVFWNYVANLQKGSK